jgi:glycosyltransferase involved in cell wall biosynthesis
LKGLARFFGKQTAPDVTVVVPIHNKEKYLAQCLASVLSQENIQLEVICVDDASTDSSLEVVAQFQRDSRVRLVRNSINIGAGQSRNIGIKSARGRYLQFTDADDLLPPNSLEQLFSAAKRTEADLIQGRIQMVSGGEVDVGTGATYIPERVGKFEALPALWIPWFHVAFLISRQLLRRSGALYPSLRVGEDPVFMAKVLTSAKKICSTGQITYFYRIDDDRKGQSAVTPFHVEDYIEHARLVKKIYGEKNAKAWAAYREFIIPDIHLLLSRVHCDHEKTREDFYQKIAAL